MSGDAAPAHAIVYQLDPDDQDVTELRPMIINAGTISDTTSEGERSRMSRRHRSRDRVHARGASPSASPTRSGQPFVHVTLEAAALSPPTATDLGGAKLSNMGTLGSPSQFSQGDSGSAAVAQGFSSGSAAAGPRGTGRDHVESAGFGRSGSAAAGRTQRGSMGSADASPSLLFHDGNASMDGASLQQEQLYRTAPTRMNAVLSLIHI